MTTTTTILAIAVIALTVTNLFTRLTLKLMNERINILERQLRQLTTTHTIDITLD